MKHLELQTDDPLDISSDDSTSDSSSTDNSSDDGPSSDDETHSLNDDEKKEEEEEDETDLPDDDDDSDDVVQMLKQVEEDRCADTVVITKDKDGTRKASLATQEEHYEHRGEALKDYSLIEWAAKIVVQKRPTPKTKKQLAQEQLQKAQRNPTNAGRIPNQRWSFRADYKFAKSHTSKSLTRLQRTYAPLLSRRTVTYVLNIVRVPSDSASKLYTFPIVTQLSSPLLCILSSRSSAPKR